MTTLTKRMAEDLTQYYQELGVKVRYLHSDIDTLERVEILRDLRRGVFDVLVGINLLREGLDLPEVSLVAILDADKEGFLRSAGSLIQTSGRAARNVNGRVIMYADTMTDSMRLRDQRDRAPPGDPGGLQRRARHHAAVDRPGHRRRDVERLRARLPDAGRDRSTATERFHNAGRAGRPPREARRPQMKQAAGEPGLRAGGVAPRRHQTVAQARAGPAAPPRGGLTRVLASSKTGSNTPSLEVQEYVRLVRAAIRRHVHAAASTTATSSSSSTQIGVGSLTVVLLTGFFTGAVLALQSGMTLDQFGARPVVGRLVSASMIKELGPVLTALMLTGRVGSGIAAELGSMVVDRADERAARARHRSDPQAGGAARAGRAR